MALLTHTPKKSSHIKSMEYDDVRQIASVTFANAKDPYRYQLPPDVFHSWVKWNDSGHSPGAFFHRFIKNFKRVLEPTNDAK